jgi:hypothetical protein
MLRRDEKRCDFGVSLPCHIIYSHFVDFVNFCCHAQASQLFEPAQASLPHLIATMTKANVVDLSSSDTKALLDTLFMSPACGSPVSHPCMVSGCNSFEDWPESNDMAVSVYAAALSVMLQVPMPLRSVTRVLSENLVLATHPLTSSALS